jgi:glycine/D-amino acid oxidase-like deaminating enzyme
LALWAYPSSIVPLSYKLHKQLADKYGGDERWGYRAVHCGSVDCKGRNLTAKDTVKGKDNDMDGKNDLSANREKNSVSLEKNPPKVSAKLAARGIPKDLDWIHPDCLRMYDEMGDPSTTAQVHPFQFTTAMAELAAEKGADVRVGAAVKSINRSKDGKGVESVTYEDKNDNNKEVTISASDIIISAGPWTREVYPDAPITATRAHSVTIRPTREISAYALFTEIKLPAGFGGATDKSKKSQGEQHVSPEIYTRPKNEVYACGEGDHMVRLPKSSDLVQVDEQRCQDIVDYVSSISDELRDGEVTARQACYLPNVQGGNGPLIGNVPGVKGLLIAAGHTCWGIQNGPATGKLISEFVFDGAAKSAKIGSLDPRTVM